MKVVYIICGPTASGKSELAINLAKKIHGSIINADSMQVYNALPILTSSPKENEKEIVPHFLYNFLDPEIKYSVGKYLEDCAVAIKESLSNGYTPIITGGTGMYINAVVNGISDIPEISREIRNEVQDFLNQKGLEELHNLLSKLDPESAAKLNKTDKQRVSRAYEVFLQTGKSILEFQKNIQSSILKNYKIRTIYVRAERKFLYELCDQRFDNMLKGGALEEVKEFMNYHSHINHGIINALGAKEIMDYLSGRVDIDSASCDAKKKTRNYAKRQYTWFNNQINWDHSRLEFASIDEYRSASSNLEL